MKRQIDVICFSGTGNTKRMTDIVMDVLEKNDFSIHFVSERNSYVHEKGREVLLAFPINSQSVSPYIWKYMKALPDGMGDKIHVMVTLNQSQAILTSLKKVLVKKNYLPQGVVEISMPNNLLIGQEDITYQRLEEAKIQAESFANDILHNTDSWKEKKKGSAFVSFLSRDTVLPWITMRMFNKLETDESKCKKCGLCVRECPVQNISMKDFPVHKNQCQFCMHCGAVCQNGAVRFKGKSQYKIRTVEQSEKEAEKVGENEYVSDKEL